MKLKDIQGDRALETLADLLDPIAHIMADDKMISIFKSGRKINAVQYAIKNHKEEITTILALLDGEDPKEYKVNLMTLPFKLMELVNDEDLQGLFLSQGLTETSSGSAMENTEVEKQ